MLGDFGDEMDQTSSRMDSVLKKLEKVSHMTSSKFTHTDRVTSLQSLRIAICIHELLAASSTNTVRNALESVDSNIFLSTPG